MYGLLLTLTRQIKDSGSIIYTGIPPSLIISFILYNYLAQYRVANLAEKSQERAVPELKNF